MVNSPVISAGSASDDSSTGVFHPPRISSRSLFTMPPGVVEHPCAVVGGGDRSHRARYARLSPLRRAQPARRFLPRPTHPNRHGANSGRPYRPAKNGEGWRPGPAATLVPPASPT